LLLEVLLTSNLVCPWLPSTIIRQKVPSPVDIYAVDEGALLAIGGKAEGEATSVVASHGRGKKYLKDACWLKLS